MAQSEANPAQPEVAAVGLNEQTCRANNIPYRVAFYSNALVNRAIAMRRTDGFVKMFCRPGTGTVLGDRGPFVEAVDRLRGAYHVTDYRWFDLRDHNSGSSNFQHHYGLLRDDYSPKPGFEVYRQLEANAKALRRSRVVRPFSG